MMRPLNFRLFSVKVAANPQNKVPEFGLVKGDAPSFSIIKGGDDKLREEKADELAASRTDFFPTLVHGKNDSVLILSPKKINYAGISYDEAIKLMKPAVSKREYSTLSSKKPTALPCKAEPLTGYLVKGGTKKERMNKVDEIRSAYAEMNATIKGAGNETVILLHSEKDSFFSHYHFAELVSLVDKKPLPSIYHAMMIKNLSWHSGVINLSELQKYKSNLFLPRISELDLLASKTPTP